jgi:hypothetical protein
MKLEIDIGKDLLSPHDSRYSMGKGQSSSNCWKLNLLIYITTSYPFSAVDVFGHL